MLLFICNHIEIRRIMKKKIIIVILFILVVLLEVVAVMHFGHTKVSIHSNCEISNRICVYNSSEATELKKNICTHNAFKYGQYSYIFDLSVDGKSIPAEIEILKTDAVSHYDVDITVNIIENGGKKEADLEVKVNGRIEKKHISDIESEKIYFKLGA